MIFDSHFHPQLFSHDELITIFQQDNVVQKWMGVGLEIDDSYYLDQISKQYLGLSYSIGLHPSNVNQDNYLKIASSQILEAKAIGETGLDFKEYHSMNSSNLSPLESQGIELQKKSFHCHMQRAYEAKLPVIIHTRCAEKETIEILQHYGRSVRGVLHCFTGSLEMALEAVSLGYFISFSGILTFNKQNVLEEVARKLPLEFILLETDAPYLTPHPYRSVFPNKPANIIYTLAKLAQIKGMNQQKVEDIIFQNTLNFFNL